jgi:hypothetical protein
MGYGYFGISHSVTISDETTRQERCKACGTLFEYTFSRAISGTGHNPFGLYVSAKRKTEEYLRAQLRRELATAVVPVHCPRCGVYQPPMVALLKVGLGITTSQTDMHANGQPRTETTHGKLHARRTQ